MTCPSDTPLHLAIRSFKGDENPVRILLKRDGYRNINVRNLSGETPLLLAVQNKKCSLKLIKLLIKYGADVKATLPRDGNTALHLVSIIRYTKEVDEYIASELLANGSDANVKNLQGCIPLHLAAEAKFTPCGFMFVLYLAHKSDVNARNSNGDTPLHVYMGNKKGCSSDMKIIFLENFGNFNVFLNAVNSKGETPLHLAVRSNHCNFDLIKKFLNLGADMTIRDATGENAYQAFCRTIVDEENNSKREDILMSQTLLQGNLQQQISSSLHVACLFHNVDSVHKLLRVGTDVNAINPFDRSPLYYASIVMYDEDSENKCSTLQLMLDYGADINQRYDALQRPDNNYHYNHRTFLEMETVFSHFCWSERLVNNSNFYLDKQSIFAQHAAKLLALQEKQVERGIDVQLLNERNLQVLNTDYFIGRAGYIDWLSRCSEELQAMSEIKIGESKVSFYDLLMVTSAKETAMYAKNNEFVKAFHAKEAMFPMYQGMMKAKIDKAIERRKLIKSAAVSMCNALEFADPSNEFYEITFSYCSNQDLVNVTNGLGEI